MTEWVKGQRIKLSPQGLKTLVPARPNRNTTGTLTCAPGLPYCGITKPFIRVLVDGQKYPDTFHEKFWEEE